MDEDAVLTAIGKLQGSMEGIDKRIESIETTLKEDTRSCRKCKEGLETRLGKLELFQNTVIAYAGMVSLAITIAGNWVLSHLPGGSS